MKSPADKLLPTLATWELNDLRELQAALNGLIQARSAPPDQKPGVAKRDEDSAGRVGAKATVDKQVQGHIEVKYIPRGNKKHGPYLYLRYWHGGKLRSKYLGKPKS